MAQEVKLQFGELVREHPKASPGRSCRRRKAVTDEGKTGTGFTNFSFVCLPG